MLQTNSEYLVNRFPTFCFLLQHRTLVGLNFGKQSTPSGVLVLEGGPLFHAIRKRRMAVVVP